MPNIKVVLLQRNEIDIERWDECIKNAFNQRIYAYSWYLDIMTKKSWSALIFGSYEAVFPIFSKKLLLIPYVTQPYLCQQLGVFGMNDQDIKDFGKTILKFLNSKFIKADLLINQHFVQSSDLVPKVNHILHLNKPYKELNNQYNRNTKRNLKKSLEYAIEIKESKDIKGFVDFLELFDKTKVIKSIKGQIETLIKYALDKNVGKILTADHNIEKFAACFYIESSDRIYFLLCGSSTKGIEQKTMYPLIDYIINKYAESGKILDFTGSNMDNIARRNEGFGAVTETYFHLKTFWRRLHRISPNLLKSI